MTIRERSILWAIIGLGSLLAYVLAAPPASGETSVQANAREALDYIEQHLPEGVQLPVVMREQGPAVLACENRELDPRAVSATGDYGIWQVNAWWQRYRLERMGLTREDLLDPVLNAVVAIEIFNEQGWGPWSCRKVLR